MAEFTTKMCENIITMMKEQPALEEAELVGATKTTASFMTQLLAHFQNKTITNYDTLKVRKV